MCIHRFAMLSFPLLVLLAIQPSLAASEWPDEGMPAGINWYGVLRDGLAEATRTGKPILLTSAAPQCIGVSGMW